MTDVRASNATLQVVHKGTIGSRARISSVTVQVVADVIAEYARISQAMLQVVHKGTSGARTRATDAFIQAVYTTGAPNNTRQRAWTFDLDGHTFYALDLATSGTLLYDLTTQSWTHYETAGFGGHWNMKNGHAWRGGKKVVGGDTSSGKVYYLDVNGFLDEGWRPVIYEVRGVIFATDIAYHRQYALRLQGSAGKLADDLAPVLNMQFSDDQGATWSDEYTVTLQADTRQRIEFRSLGSFTSPGRIFRLYDTGGIKFLAYVTAETDGDGNPSA